MLINFENQQVFFVHSMYRWKIPFHTQVSSFLMLHTLDCEDRNCGRQKALKEMLIMWRG